MPIRLNLLAEAQAAEELRRRDPVKRAIWVGCLLVVGMLVWSSSVYVKGLMAKQKLSAVRGSIAARTNEYNLVLKNQAQTTDMKHRLASLRQLSTHRFLNGNLLDALQHVTLEDVQLMRLKMDMLYAVSPEVKGKTNTDGRIVGAKAASIKEAIVLTLEARDSSPNPGDRVNSFKEAISTNAYFQSVLSKTNGVRLTYVSNPTVLPDSKPFVMFTVEGRYPERTR